MKRQYFTLPLLFPALCSWAGGVGSSRDGQVPAGRGLPNVIVIYADDLGYGDLQCYGAKNVKTPHVDRLAAEGMPFRDAYKKVGLDIEAGKFTHNKQVHHTHAGSIGNLCNDKIVGLMEEISKGFNFSAVEQAEKSLLGR